MSTTSRTKMPLYRNLRDLLKESQFWTRDDIHRVSELYTQLENLKGAGPDYKSSIRLLERRLGLTPGSSHPEIPQLHDT